MKKGISLIVLVITIIIIIILAGAVILNLSNKNPIDNANLSAALSEQADLTIAPTATEDVTKLATKPGYTVAGSTTEVEAGYLPLALWTITPNGDVGELTAVSGATILTKAGFTPTKASATEVATGYTILMNASGNVIFGEKLPAETPGA